jgi:hypothetical protein
MTGAKAFEDRSVDGLCGDVIFCTWTGSTPMSPRRLDCLVTIYGETHCPVILITPQNIGEWVVPDAPLHKAFPYLSDVHKADYIRCYLMHHFGGGYTDIKKTSLSWKPHFARMRETPQAFGLGYTEIGPYGVAPIPDPLGDVVRANYRRVIGNCAYIFRKGTAFTKLWLDTTHALLDAKFEDLILHPAQHAMDQFGITLPDGAVSAYPLRWQEMLGEIFHPLVFANSERFLHAQIAPLFSEYR